MKAGSHSDVKILIENCPNFGRFKSFTSKRSGRGSLWHRNYHDRVIRNERELDEIRTYVDANPRRWHEDRYYA